MTQGLLEENNGQILNSCQILSVSSYLGSNKPMLRWNAILLWKGLIVLYWQMLGLNLYENFRELQVRNYGGGTASMSKCDFNAKLPRIKWFQLIYYKINENSVVQREFFKQFI